MKIQLIIPQSPFLTNEKVFVSLGILKIASFLEKKGVDVSCIDLSGVQNWKEELQRSLEKDCDYVGITAVTPQLPIVIGLCSFIKEVYPSIKIIIGGPHVTMSYSSIKKGSIRAKSSFDQLASLVDKIVIGYGELAILKAIELNSPKIIDAEEDPNIRITNDLYESLPLPARHMVDLESYKYGIDSKKSTNLICQLGCPYNCSFCGGRMSDTYRNVRKRPIKSIINEIDFLVNRYGYRGFMFYDDELNINPHSFEELLNELVFYQKEKGVDLSFRGFTRADLLTESQAELMYKAGFRWLLVGFESGSNRILTNMNKKTTVEQNTATFNMARKAGLKVKALMSVGHPGESKTSVNETKDWLLQVHPDETDITIITLYPGSDYFDKSVYNGTVWEYTSPTTGDKLYSDNNDYIHEQYFYKSRNNEYVSHVSTNFLSKEELVICREMLEKEMQYDD